jgi:hypothetical protein
MKNDYELQFIKEPRVWQCPYCLKDTGFFGNWLAKLFGTRIHKCNFSNTSPFKKNKCIYCGDTNKINETVDGPMCSECYSMVSDLI